MPRTLGPKKKILEGRFLSSSGTAPPAGLFDEFCLWIETVTYGRLKIAAILAICVNLPLFLAFDLVGFQAGYAQSKPGFLYLVYWRIAFISVAALFLAISAATSMQGGSAFTPLNRWIGRGFILAVAWLGAIQSGIAHVMVHDVSIYGLMICVIAAILHTPDRFRWLVYASAFALLCVLAAWRKPPEIFYSMMINAAPVTAIALAIELIVFRQLEDVFINMKIAAAEREKSETLLRNVLPAAIAAKLRTGQEMIAEGFPEATILFADLVGFTELSAKVRPEQLVDLLNDVFGRFDDLAVRHGVEKIKTIGDAYMVACGLPGQNANHLGATAEFALDVLAELEVLNKARSVDLKLRVGIHSGYVVAGVIGHNKFSYDVWGDNVNLASRMESSGLPGRIQVTESVALRLKDRYVLEERGSVEVKGKGVQKTYFLLGRSDQ